MSSPVNISNCERIEHGKKRNKDRETKDKHRDRAKTNKGFLFVKHTSGKIETKFITVIQEKKCLKFKQKSIQSLDLLTSHSHMKVISPDLELSSVSQSSSEDWRTEMMQQILKQNCFFNHFEYIDSSQFKEQINKTKSPEENAFCRKTNSIHKTLLKPQSLCVLKVEPQFLWYLIRKVEIP